MRNSRRFVKVTVGSEEDWYYTDTAGGAFTAYSMLQFCGREMVEPLRRALLRYCELDTMAMVFVWEYFNKACNVAR